MKFITVLLLFLMANVCIADDTAFGGNGTTPIPIQQPNVKMLNEKIVIDGDNLNRENMSGIWHYHCDFTFQNTLNAPLSFVMGFPFPIREDDENITIPLGQSVKKGGALVYNFVVTVDGKQVKSKPATIGPNQEHALFYKQAYLWTIDLLPLQLFNVHHEYSTGITYDVMGYNWVSYVLKTGGLWKDGYINQAQLIVNPNTPTHLCNEVAGGEKNYLKTTPSEMKIITNGKIRSYVWDLQHFSPNNDLNLCIQTGRDFIRYGVVYKIINKNQDLVLTQLSSEQLKIMRNTIYAQYGRKFVDPNLQAYFNKQWWYMPNQNYNDKMLTKEDHQALELLRIATSGRE